MRNEINFNLQNISNISLIKLILFFHLNSQQLRDDANAFCSNIFPSTHRKMSAESSFVRFNNGYHQYTASRKNSRRS